MKFRLGMLKARRGVLLLAGRGCPRCHGAFCTFISSTAWGDGAVPGGEQSQHGPQGLSSTVHSRKAAPSPLLWFCPTSLPHLSAAGGHCPTAAPGPSTGKGRAVVLHWGFWSRSEVGVGGSAGSPHAGKPHAAPHKPRDSPRSKGGPNLRPHLNLSMSSQKPLTLPDFTRRIQLSLEETQPANAPWHREDGTDKLGTGSCKTKALQTRPRSCTNPTLQSAGLPPSPGRAGKSPRRAWRGPYRQR